MRLYPHEIIQKKVAWESELKWFSNAVQSELRKSQEERSVEADKGTNFTGAFWRMRSAADCSMKAHFRSQASYEDVCFIYISKQGEGLREN